MPSLIFMLCTDVNECASELLCQGVAVCRNTPGSFRCDCPDGYRLSQNNNVSCEGVSCNDLCELFHWDTSMYIIIMSYFQRSMSVLMALTTVKEWLSAGTQRGPTNVTVPVDID